MLEPDIYHSLYSMYGGKLVAMHNLCYVYIMFPAATAAPFQAAVVKTGCAVPCRDGT